MSGQCSRNVCNCPSTRVVKTVLVLVCVHDSALNGCFPSSQYEHAGHVPHTHMDDGRLPSQIFGAFSLCMNMSIVNNCIWTVDSFSLTVYTTTPLLIYIIWWGGGLLKTCV